MATYADRSDLSKELDEKLAKAPKSGSARAVAVIGLGGTGKTQLVLHYLQKHEADYNIVLWIDVRNKEAARSSFERCCRVLGLAIEPSPDDRPLKDLACVQAVLTLLRNQAEHDKWLVIVDNADDLSWGVGSVIPRGKAGTVLVTSQDARALRLLGGCIQTVSVDAMQLEEAVCLMANCFDKSVTRGDGYWDLVERVTESLDRLALAMDLAGARISMDTGTCGGLAAALRQYLDDYQHHQDRLLQDTSFVLEKDNEKTAWTALDTSLSSLRAEEQSIPDIYPVQLLAFMTLFDRANVQDELFRLASLGLDEACTQLDDSVPSWLRKLLEKNINNEWNGFYYRETVKCLLRYSLIRPVSEPWKGITMHGLVQRRAQQELLPGHPRWHLIFLYAISLEVNRPIHMRFRRHLMLHLPTNDQLLKGQNPLPEETHRARLWLRIGDLWEREARLKEAAELQVRAIDAMIRAYGETSRETLDAMSGLAGIFSQQGLLEKAKELITQVIRVKEAKLGAQHIDTLESRHQLAIMLSKEGRWEEAVEEDLAILEARRANPETDQRVVLHSMATLAITYNKMGKLRQAQELEVEVFESRKESLGRDHPMTRFSMGNLAITYSKQGEYEKAEELQIEMLDATIDLFGYDHEEAMRSMGNLGMTYSKAGKLEKAEELQAKALDGMRRLYGIDHPKTLKYAGDLARTLAKQGRLVEAEEMQVGVFGAMSMSTALGPEHFDTLKAMDDLAVTLRCQGRWEEAGDLGSKAVEASSRSLGRSHPRTLRAMANLACAKRGLGQNDVAVDLMEQSAKQSFNVLGESHPYSRERCKQAVAWSDMDKETEKHRRS